MQEKLTRIFLMMIEEVVYRDFKNKKINDIQEIKKKSEINMYD